MKTIIIPFQPFGFMTRVGLPGNPIPVQLIVPLDDAANDSQFNTSRPRPSIVHNPKE